MKQVFATVALLAFAFAQQGLSGEPSRFAQDMIGQLGGIVVACPQSVSAEGQVMCVNLEREFEDFRPEWDLWIPMHLPTFGGSLVNGWRETRDAFEAIYSFPGYQLKVAFYPNPGEGPRMILVQTKS